MHLDRRTLDAETKLERDGFTTTCRWRATRTLER